MMAAMAFADVTDFHIHMFALVPTDCFFSISTSHSHLHFRTIGLALWILHYTNSASANVAVNGELAPGHRITAKVDNQTLYAIDWKQATHRHRVMQSGDPSGEC
jgi:hypothetical protein